MQIACKCDENRSFTSLPVADLDLLVGPLPGVAPLVRRKRLLLLEHLPAKPVPENKRVWQISGTLFKENSDTLVTLTGVPSARGLGLI